MILPRIKRTRPSAFSLIEIMVAVSLLSVLIVGLLAMFYQTQRAFRLGVGQIDVMESGRLVIEMLGRELQETVAAGETNLLNIQFELNPEATLFTQSLPSASGEERTNMLFDLYFLRNENDAWIGTVYRVSNPELGAGNLYKLQSPPVRKQDLRDVESLRASKFDSATALAIADAPQMRRLVDGIVHFRLIPYDRNGYPLLTNSLDVVARDDRYIYRFKRDSLPAYLDLELGILEGPAYATFLARPDPVKRTYLKQQAAKLHLFRKRIPLRAAP